MVDNTAAFMALDRQSGGAIAPYQSGVDMSAAKPGMLALLDKINVKFPWAPPGLSSIGAQVFALGGFPRLRAYLPDGGARPSWLADDARYQQWRRMIQEVYKPIDTAFLKQNSALTAAATDWWRREVMFWDDVYGATDTINMASPIRIASNIADGYKDFKDNLGKSWKPAAAIVGVVAVLGVFGYFKYFRKRK
jgi:hypothetical protein